MAKEVADVTTIDLFCTDVRPGRPRTNPNPRDVQVKINKRNQVKRDKHKGLKRIEFKVHERLFAQLDQLAQARGQSRGELIEFLLTDSLKTLKS